MFIAQNNSNKKMSYYNNGVKLHHRSPSISIASRRNTNEHSGNSPRSANKESSSSPIEKIVVISFSPMQSLAINGLSSNVEEVDDSKSENHPNSQVKVPSKFVNLPSHSNISGFRSFSEEVECVTFVDT